MTEISQKISGTGHVTKINYEVWFNEEKEVLCLKQFNPLTVEDVYQVQQTVQKMVKDKTRRLVLVDLTEGPADMVGKEARRAFRETANPKDFDKIAVFGTSSATRMLAKIILAITGVSDITQFFKTEHEALAWLKEN
ncbi:hypothetical protein GF359_00365 [candidate division WOR-3 bacterium]|uniref:STAS/SEC14 domain-containing protein n=1 Tax=candidate division WOR-3 bacterium TaxID=2052148 RepID=A0A9D5K7A6_UNCW3|nr:hypothetical protein [candidate division WOR-3 bacterium]MBD3363646.1 hypothetical protein [candidate division WOR-3 bacterium]